MLTRPRMGETVTLDLDFGTLAVHAGHARGAGPVEAPIVTSVATRADRGST